MSLGFFRIASLDDCDHSQSIDDFNLCSVMRNIAVNGVRYVASFLNPQEAGELLTLISKIQNLEQEITRGINAFTKTNSRNTTNIDRRTLLVKILTMVVRHPFFVWGQSHKLIKVNKIFETIDLLTARTEIIGQQIRDTLVVIEMFLEWTRKLRRFGLTLKPSTLTMHHHQCSMNST